MQWVVLRQTDLTFFHSTALFEIGTPVSGSACSYTITPHKNKSDIFISPTYPGAYPKDMSCSYQFIGEPTQRVRLEFRDFDLFFGGPQLVLFLNLIFNDLYVITVLFSCVR